MHGSKATMETSASARRAPVSETPVAEPRPAAKPIPTAPITSPPGTPENPSARRIGIVPNSDGFATGCIRELVVIIIVVVVVIVICVIVIVRTAAWRACFHYDDRWNGHDRFVDYGNACMDEIIDHLSSTASFMVPIVPVMSIMPIVSIVPVVVVVVAMPSLATAVAVLFGYFVDTVSKLLSPFALLIGGDYFFPLRLITVNLGATEIAFGYPDVAVGVNSLMLLCTT